MKKSLLIASIFVAISALFLVAAVHLLLGDVVESEYATLEKAHRDELFGRGWLPDILPPSTVDIQVSNNLDLNTSEGEFAFNPAEWQLLEAQLNGGAFSNAPFSGWPELVRKRKKEGYSSFSYSEGSTKWVFFCKPQQGHCEYLMWLQR